MVSALDDSVGNVTMALHRKGMLNNTIIVFSTDNGGPAAGFDWNHASNAPLRYMHTQPWSVITRVFNCLHLLLCHYGTKSNVWTVYISYHKRFKSKPMGRWYARQWFHLESISSKVQLHITPHDAGASVMFECNVCWRCGFPYCNDLLCLSTIR